MKRKFLFQIFLNIFVTLIILLIMRFFNTLKNPVLHYTEENTFLIVSYFFYTFFIATIQVIYFLKRRNKENLDSFEKEGRGTIEWIKDPSKIAHCFVETKEGLIYDPTLRDLLASYGAKFSDITEGAKYFSKKEHEILIERLPKLIPPKSNKGECVKMTSNIKSIAILGVPLSGKREIFLLICKIFNSLPEVYYSETTSGIFKGAKTPILKTVIKIESDTFQLKCIPGVYPPEAIKLSFDLAREASIGIFVFDTQETFYSDQIEFWNSVRTLIDENSWFYLLNKSDLNYIEDIRRFLLVDYGIEKVRPNIQISAISSSAYNKLKTFFTDYIFTQSL